MGWLHWLLQAKRDLQGAPPVSWYRLQDQWRFSGEGLMPVGPLLAVVALIAVVLILIRGWRSGLFSRRTVTPVSIFRHVIRDWGLARSEVSLLIRIARQQQLPSPLTLVLSAATLDHHVRAYAKSIADGSHRHIQLDSQVRHIAHVLFGNEQASESKAHST